MNSRERMFNVLCGKDTDVIPVGLHAWGLYKFQLAGVISGYAEEEKVWAIGGKELADIESHYYETFKPDFFHLSEGPCIYPKHKMIDPKYKELMVELRLLESKNIIDTFVDICYPGPEEYIKSGRFEHVKILSEKYGREVFIALHNATPVNDVFDQEGFLGGFQEAMIAAVEKTEMLAYLIYKSHEKHLDYQRALAKCGAHAHISTEAYLGAELVSPLLYEKLLFEAQKNYYRGVKKIGLIPIMCFWGNINPLVKYFKQLDIDGILIEESRKGYVLDVAEIKREIGDSITVFGNIPGETLMLYGTPEEVERETRKMIDSLDHKKRFVMCTGTPLAFDTPKDNILALLGEARNYRL